MSLVRLLALPDGSDRDADGRAHGDDWPLASLGSGEDGTRYYLTTDRVRASEFCDYPGLEPRALGEWLVARINEAHDARFDGDAWPTYVPPLLTVPPEDAWVRVGDREWASNGAVMIPRDGEPFAATEWRAIDSIEADPPTPEHIAGVLPTEPLGEALVLGDDVVASDGYFPKWPTSLSVRHALAEAFPDRVALRGPTLTTYINHRYAPLLERGFAWQTKQDAPIYVWDDGRIVAVVMPMRTPS